MCRLYDQTPFLILDACELGEKKIEGEREYSAGVDMLKILVLAMPKLKVKMRNWKFQRMEWTL